MKSVKCESVEVLELDRERTYSAACLAKMMRRIKITTRTAVCSKKVKIGRLRLVPLGWI